MLQAARQHTQHILRGFSTNYVNSSAHGMLFAHRLPKPGTKASPGGHGCLAEAGPGWGAGSLEDPGPLSDHVQPQRAVTDFAALLWSQPSSKSGRTGDGEHKTEALSVPGKGTQF